MSTRRNFLTFGAVAGAAAITPNTLFTQSVASTVASKGTSVHEASLKILMKHLRAMSKIIAIIHLPQKNWRRWYAFNADRWRIAGTMLGSLLQ
jgi:hypothetical protein